MATTTDELVIKIKIAHEKATAALAKVRKKFKGLGTNIVKYAKRAAIALAGITTALGAMVFSAAKAGDEIAKMSKRLNISTESLSALRFQAGLAGTDFKATAQGIRFMTKAMYDSTQGLETAKRGFKLLGLSVTKADGKLKDAEEMFLEISDALAKMEDGTEKTAAAQLLFGSRMGTQLIPLLNQGSGALREQAEEARKLGIIFDKEAAKKAEGFVDSMLRLKKSLEGVKFGIAKELMPTVEKYVKQLKDWILQNEELIKQNIQLTIKAIAEALVELRDGASAIAEFVRENSKLIKSLSSMALGFGAVTLAMSIATGNIPGAITAIALLKTAAIALGVAWGTEKIKDFSNKIKVVKPIVDDLLVPMHKFNGDLGLVSTHSSSAATALEKMKGVIKAFPELFKKAGEVGVSTADNLKEKWKNTSEGVKKAFETLGIIPKEQFEGQVKDIVKAFQTVAKSGSLSDEEVVRSRATMFEKLRTLASQAEEGDVVGVNIEDFREKLNQLEQDLVSQTRGAIRTLKDSTGQDVTELFKEFQVDIKNANEIILQGFTKDSVTLAQETVSGINGLFESTTTAQQGTFSVLTDEIIRLAEFQYGTEESITQMMEAENEKRLAIVKSFTDSAIAEYQRIQNFRSQTIPAFGGAQSGAYGTLSGGDSELPFFVEDGYATGTPYVPKTGFYQLHQGEAVIPANQNNGNASSNDNRQDNRQFNAHYYGNQQGGNVEREFEMQQMFQNMLSYDADITI